MKVYRSVDWSTAPTWANWLLIRYPSIGVVQKYWLQKKPRTRMPGDNLKQIPCKKPPGKR